MRWRWRCKKDSAQQCTYMLINMTCNASKRVPNLQQKDEAQVVIDNAVADNAKATKAISQMMAVWSLMQGLLQSVVDDLSQAADPEVLPILQKAEFDAARQVWVHLSEIAKSIASGR